jgi:threonine dehydrogenase-like Zn-dependent dehydrogenase
VPDHIPFEVAALNEPMAVARHGTASTPGAADKVVVTFK